MLNLDAALGQLYAEKARLDAAIEQLSLLQAAPDIPPPPGKRGRKSMGMEERQEVSRRMRDYWTQQRRIAEFKADTYNSAEQMANFSDQGEPI